MRLLTLLFVAALPLQGCEMVLPQPVPVPQPQPQADLSSCHAVGLEGLIGQPVRLLPSQGAWGTLRVIKPGMMVTKDYSPTRLNVQVDDSGIIVALSCG